MDERDELLRFAISPFFGVNPWAWMDVYQGRTDWKETVRNAAIWGSIPLTVNAANALLQPGKYAWSMRGLMHGSTVVASHIPIGAVIPAAVAVASVGGAHVVTSTYEDIVVDKAPEHEKSGWWEFFATMLTGTGPAASYTDI